MRLLLAEDEQELSRAVVAILNHYAFEVDAVYNGADALEHATAGTYDGIILDIMMPRLDGISVLKALRAQGDSTPILMLTAKAEVEDKIAGLDQGANDYLTKPFSMKELVARIRAMIRTRQQLLPGTMEVANIRLNRSSSELSSDSASISLSHQEFQLLELLLSNPGTAFTRAQLREKVWQDDGQDGAVRLYISYLKNKLSSVQAQVVISEAPADTYVLEFLHD